MKVVPLSNARLPAPTGWTDAPALRETSPLADTDTERALRRKRRVIESFRLTKPRRLADSENTALFHVAGKLRNGFRNGGRSTGSATTGGVR